MSVRYGILAILTLGPAYGLQLHGEFLSRAAHRSAVNVGQVYGTLDRLGAQGTIERTGATDDGLPLYRLSPDGEAEAIAWLSGEAPVDPDWTEMLDRVLLACSLPAADAEAVVSAHLAHWRSRAAAARAAADDGDASGLARAAEADLADAATRWLTGILPTAASGALVRGLTEARPRRGRRPAASVP
ncbi:MAG TPA: PadR family transcriptional regulator [Naasia sp.]|jgi:DNA-binding PadR family transcriptional regulator